MRLKGLLFILLLLLFNCAREGQSHIPLSDYVPSDAVAAVKINHLSALRDSLESSDFLSRLENLEPYRAILKKVASLAYIGQDAKGMLIFSKTGKDSIGFLYVSEGLSNFFDMDSLPNKSADELDFGKHTITKFIIDDQAVYLALSAKKLFLGSSPKLLIDALELPEQPPVENTFKRLYAISDETKPATIFIHLDQSDELFSPYTNEHSDLVLSDFSDWAALDIDSRQMQFSLNGLSLANDSISNFLNLFKKTKPLPNVTASFAPLGSEAILSYSFDDYGVFAANQKQYLNLPTIKDSLFNAVEEIGIITIAGEGAVILNTYGSESLSDYMAGMQKSVADYQGNSILELGEADFLSNALQPIVTDFKANFGTVLENAFIFAQDEHVLQTIISNYKNGTTFDKSPVYNAVGQATASSATIMFISNSDHLEQNVKNDLSEDLYKDLKDPKLAGYAFTAQVVADGDFFHTNLSAIKMAKGNKIRGVGTRFTVALEATMAGNPQFVVNHLTKKKEIVVQDQDNMLYLISNDGELVWKKQLSGKIQGRIRQVDLFKNGRLQLAFTTSDRFMILDRNGKEVEGFNKSYPGGNLNPLAVFDYEGKKDYRLVVTQNNNVFMYDRKGKIVSGFKFTKAEKNIVAAPIHMAVGNKDYLVFQLQDGSLKLLNRTGQVRTKVNGKIDFSGNPVLLYKNQFTVTDKKGILYQIATNGKTVKTNLDLNQDHGIDGLGNTLVYMNDNVLSIKGRKVELELGVYTVPKIFLLYDKIYVTVTDIQNQKVYLFDSLAEPIPNFPVFGSSIIDLADIDGDKKLELVTKEGDASLMVYDID